MGYNYVDDIYGSIVILLAVVGYQIYEIVRNSDRIHANSSSRSSKVIDLGANRNVICNFLIVINCNFGSTIFRILTFKARK